MKKKILTFLCFIFMVFGMFTGCSGFVVEDESLIITSITSQVLDDGRTMVVITYADEDIAPAIFYIPQGEEGIQGEEGNGIKEITYEIDEKTGTIFVTINFTDDSMDPVTYELRNGVSIISVEQIIDEETGQVSFIVKYSDGTQSDPIIVPEGKKGEDGKDGIGIIGYYHETNDNGDITLTFVYSDGNIYTCDIPKGEKGENGRGIVAIIGYEDDEKYYLIISYSDETQDIIPFDKPQKPNTWLTGTGKPGTSLGNDGDFYFDVERKDIYSKINGEWIKVVDFEDDETKYTLEFNFNCDDAYYPEGYGYEKYYTVKAGNNFASTKTLVPIPVRNGYVFEGWYTTPNPTVVNGMFTDLTPVMSDMVLYAKWSIAK